MGAGKPHSGLSRATSRRGIKQQAPNPLRRSARFRDKRLADKKIYPSPSTTDKDPSGKLLHAVPQCNDRKRKRQESENEQNELRSVPTEKKPRVSPIRPEERFSGVEAANSVSKNRINPIDYWRKEGNWPKEYFEMERATDHLLTQKKSSSSLRRKRSDVGSATPSSTTPSDQKPRAEKSTPYRTAQYETLLATKGSFMEKDEGGIKEDSKNICRTLLDNGQTFPEDTLFRDDLFEETCQNLQGKNESRVIRDISLLIVPSAEILASRGAKHLKILAESVNEGWNNSRPVTKPRPQPDYSVGFKRTAFTKDQLDKLQPFIGDFLNGDLSFFMATFYMYFPFLTCEVKCGTAALDVADRQNAHSMTLAVRGIVEIFKRVKREKEINREILAFSVSHDHRSVRIYGHYPVIKEEDTTFYRYPIREFCFTELGGKDKWTAYKFTKNVYDTWMPKHFKRLCSVIDELPSDLDFDVPPLSEGTGLSQVLESRLNTDSATVYHEDAGLTSLQGSQDVTPNTSFSHSSKRLRKR